MKKLALDTYYLEEDDAYTVGVLFDRWTDSEPQEIITTHTHNFASYIPGEFYKRELPCILDLLKKVKLEEIGVIILDGFLRLKQDDSKEVKDGLGMHLKPYLPEHIKLIGVAKSMFCNNNEISTPVLRGEAINPLWVQGEGYSNEEAAELIKNMYGNYRIPQILKTLDKLTKGKC